MTPDKSLAEIDTLDSIQRDIWASIATVLRKRGVKFTFGDAYDAGASIKEVLHPRVNSLIAAARVEELKLLTLKKGSSKYTMKERINRRIYYLESPTGNRSKDRLASLEGEDANSLH